MYISRFLTKFEYASVRLSVLMLVLLFQFQSSVLCDICYKNIYIFLKLLKKDIDLIFHDFEVKATIIYRLVPNKMKMRMRVC